MASRDPQRLKELGRWQDLLVDQVDGATRTPRRSLAINFPPSMAGHIIAAARRRDMSITALARRALMAFVVYDLGLDWDEVMADEPRLRTFDAQGTEPERLAGGGHGPWRITKLETHVTD